MRLALDAAARAAAWSTHPNPRVGAVIVRDDEVIATGYHRAVGLSHAETDALASLPSPELARGAEMYVTLEPCDHWAHTPPCTLALLEAGLRRVVVGTVDPDPRVSGAGIARLRAAGVEVEVGVLSDDCRALNAPFFKRITRGLPWLTLKLAQTLDGRIATRTGHSRWITGAEARAEVHDLRARHDAVLVGTGTLIADDPRLTVRTPQGSLAVARQPLRVVLDRTLRAPLERAVYDTSAAPTWLFTAQAHQEEASAQLSGRGVEVIAAPLGADGRLSLEAVLRHLVQARQVTTVLCEGGAELAASLLAAELVDEVVVYVAPRIVGGREAPGPVGGIGVATMDEALELELVSVEPVGADVRITARPRVGTGG